MASSNCTQPCGLKHGGPGERSKKGDDSRKVSEVKGSAGLVEDDGHVGGVTLCGRRRLNAASNAKFRPSRERIARSSTWRFMEWYLCN